MTGMNRRGQNALQQPSKAPKPSSPRPPRSAQPSPPPPPPRLDVTLFSYIMRKMLLLQMLHWHVCLLDTSGLQLCMRAYARACVRLETWHDAAAPPALIVTHWCETGRKRPPVRCWTGSDLLRLRCGVEVCEVGCDFFFLVTGEAPWLLSSVIGLF